VDSNRSWVHDRRMRQGRCHCTVGLPRDGYYERIYETGLDSKVLFTIFLAALILDQRGKPSRACFRATCLFALLFAPHHHCLIIASTPYPPKIYSARSTTNALFCRIHLAYPSYVPTIHFSSVKPPRWHRRRLRRRALPIQNFLRSFISCHLRSLLLHYSYK
jgi:hypothetical protein